MATIAEWLASLGLSEYAQRFAENGIDVSVIDAGKIKSHRLYWDTAAILAQLGFAVSCGIALAAFVMAMFFSPSLTALIGRRAWWPGRASRAPAAATGSRTDTAARGGR